MPDDADTILNRIGKETADKLQAKINSWFGPDSELGAYDLEAVRELGRKAI